MTRTLLITGGAGYIGSHAVKHFLNSGDRVVVLDNLSHGWRQSLDSLAELGSLEFIKADLRDSAALEVIFAEHQFDAVLHFAALCSVDESMRYPEWYFETNVNGTLQLLRAMKQFGVSRLVFSSTCAVYGEAQYLPLDESHPTNPANPYGASKLMAEGLIKWFGEIHGLSYVILRYFNVCGAASDGLIGDSKKPSLLLLQNAVRGALGIEAFNYTCQTVATPDGTPIRDYIDVEDLICAHAAALEYLEAGLASEIFNLGNGRGYSVKEIVDHIENRFQTKLSGGDRAQRLGEYAAVYADVAKANQALGWSAVKDLESSVDSLVRWYRARPNGYDY